MYDTGSKKEGTMKYSVETTVRFDKDFKKLDRYTQRMIKSWIDKNLVETENPRQHGRGAASKIFDGNGGKFKNEY